MKKGRIVLVVAACALAALVAIGIPAVRYGIESKKAQAAFTPCATGEAAEGVFAVRDDFVDAFAVSDGDSWIVFDGGVHADAVIAGFSGLGIDPGKVEAVFLTHSDYDHTAAVGHFPNARVFMSDKEVDMVNGKIHRAFLFDNKVSFKYTTIADGETMRIGMRSVKAIVTPGHTVGSACYLVDGRFLFTGDTISLRDGKICTFDDVFNMDSKLQAKSIGKIASLRGIEKILTAHYGAIGGADALFAEWNAGKR